MQKQWVARIARGAIGLAAIVCCAGLVSDASADQITVLCSNGYKAVLTDLAPVFEQRSGHTLAIRYDLSAALVRRIEQGEAFDVAVLTPALVRQLEEKGLAAPGQSSTLATTPIGLAIRSGDSRPPLDSLSAIAATIGSARSIAYAREGAAAGFFLGLVQRLALGERLGERINPLPSGAAVGEAVRSGTAQFGIIPVSEILAIPGIEVGGTFPADLAATVTMTAGVSRTSRSPSAVAELIRFLRSPAADQVLRQRGMTAGRP